MNSFDDEQSDNAGEHSSPATREQPSNPERRRFSRTALASGAVLLTLGNRSAWGGEVLGCMSITTLNSFNPETGMFMSAPGLRPEHKIDLADRIHQIAPPPEYIGQSGEWQTCQDPDRLDGVCLVFGDCPE